MVHLTAYKTTHKIKDSYETFTQLRSTYTFLVLWNSFLLQCEWLWLDVVYRLSRPNFLDAPITVLKTTSRRTRDQTKIPIIVKRKYSNVAVDDERRVTRYYSTDSRIRPKTGPWSLLTRNSALIVCEYGVHDMSICILQSHRQPVLFRRYGRVAAASQVLIYPCSRCTRRPCVMYVTRRQQQVYTIIICTRAEGIESYTHCPCAPPSRVSVSEGVKNIRAQMTETLADVKKGFFPPSIHTDP